MQNLLIVPKDQFHLKFGPMPEGTAAAEAAPTAAAIICKP
jgi:hypothetical protein